MRDLRDNRLRRRSAEELRIAVLVAMKRHGVDVVPLGDLQTQLRCNYKNLKYALSYLQKRGMITGERSKGWDARHSGDYSRWPCQCFRLTDEGKTLAESLIVADLISV